MSEFSRLIEAQNQLIEQLVLGSKIEWWYTLFSTAGGGAIAALMGALVAYKLTDRLHKKDDKRKNFQSQQSSLVELIEQFESLSIEYWSRGRCEERDATDEIKIKLLHNQIRRNFKIFSNNKFPSDTRNQIQESITQLYDFALGGEFESLRKKASMKRARKTQQYCGSIVISLSSLAH